MSPRYPISSITSRDSEPSELRLWIVTWPSAPFSGPRATDGEPEFGREADRLAESDALR